MYNIEPTWITINRKLKMENDWEKWKKQLRPIYEKEKRTEKS